MEELTFIGCVEDYNHELEENDFVVVVFLQNQKFSKDLQNFRNMVGGMEYRQVRFLFMWVDTVLCVPIVERYRVNCWPMTFFVYERTLIGSPVYGDNILEIKRKVRLYTETPERYKDENAASLLI